MAEQVVTVPLLGGIDESVDPDQLKAPGMKELTNVVVRKKERFQKREGYSLISVLGAPNDPAQVYKDGVISDMPELAEAIGTNASSSGSKIVTAAGGRLYEYVGQDSQSGYRYVNELPVALGQLLPVDASGGSCLEVESCWIKSSSGKRCRVTAWTVGRRPAAVLADDSIWWKSDIDGQGVYVAVQDDETGAFVQEPRRLLASVGVPTTDARNLRITQVYADGTLGADGGVSAVICWQSGAYGASARIDGVRVDGDLGQILQTVDVTALLPVGYRELAPTYRSFDIAPYRRQTVSPTPAYANRFMLVVGDADTVVTQTEVMSYIVDATSAPWTIGPQVPTLGTATLTRTWTPRCTRGVKISLEDDVISGNYVISARVGVVDPPAAPGDPIDMAIVTYRLEGNVVTGVYSPVADSWAIIRDMNYQSFEDFSSIAGYAGSSGKKYASKTVTEFNLDMAIGSQDNTGTYPLATGYYRLGRYPDDNVYATVDMVDTPQTRQVYTLTRNMASLAYSATSGFIGSIRVTAIEPFIPANAAPTAYAQWLALSREVHTYQPAMTLPVNMTSLAQFTNGEQLTTIGVPNCHAARNFCNAVPAGYYQNVQLNVVIPSITGVLVNPTVDVYVTHGVDTSVAPILGTTSGLANGQYFAKTGIINGNDTASFDVTVTSGAISALVCADSGYDIGTAPAVVQVSFAANALYNGSPAVANAATLQTNRYASDVILIDGGDLTRALGSAAAKFGSAGFDPTSALGTCTFVTGAGSVYWTTLLNTRTSYSFLDGADALTPLPSPAFALPPESCVHRWSSCMSRHPEGLSESVFVIVSSTGANGYTTPNGDAPMTVASVHSTNNYLEAYRWDLAPGETLLRSRTGLPPVAHLVSALAGAWRLTSDLVAVRVPNLQTYPEFNKQRFMACVTPAGDYQQCSQLLVDIGDGATQLVVLPPSFDEGATSQAYQYVGNSGMFAQSLNAPRQLTVPINTARMFSTIESQVFGSIQARRTVALQCGLLRDASSQNTSGVMAVRYDTTPESWRRLTNYADYTVINGGVPSVFDGSGAGEISPLMWPQRSYVSIAAPKEPQLYSTAKQFYAYRMQTSVKGLLWIPMLGPGGEPAALMNISRPYFMYEAGLRSLGNPYSNPIGNGVDDGWWDKVTTSFGGKPKEDYQSIAIDQRMTSYGVNSSVAGNTEPGGVKSITYYGKYGKYAAAQRWVAWVPRNTSGDIVAGGATDEYLEASFNVADAQGDMLMRWTYEVSDGTGRTVRSAPSIPVRYTIISRLDLDDSSNQVGAWVFKYGFFAPRLELTNRLRQTEFDSKRVSLQAYSTCEPYGSVFYRLPIRNFETPVSSMFAQRNANREICSHQVRPYVPSGAPYGLVLNNLTCFDGNNGEYLGLLGSPYLYTTGGESPNACPPSFLCAAVHQNRLVLGGADDATVIWISKEMTEQDAPAFSDLLTVRIADGGAVTGLGSLSRALIVFKASQIHIITGEMPDNTVAGGLTASLGQPMRLVNGLGCISHRSVISTPVGVFFQSYRTIELMGQDLAVSPIGFRIMDILETYKDVVSVTHKAVDSEVIFCCQKPSVEAGTNVDEDGSQFVLLVYNYAEDIWSKHTMSAFGQGPATVGEEDDQTMIAVGGRTYITSDTRFYDTTPDGDVWVTMSGETAPIALNQQQGYQRVKRIVLMGDPTPSLPAPSTYQPHAMAVTVSTDWDSTQNAAWTSSEIQSILAKQGREFFGVHVRNQKCQKVSIRFEDAPPTGGTITTGYGVAFSNIALTVGVKSGLNKRMTQEAEH